MSFKIFYGAAATEALAFAAFGTVGAEVYSFGQCRAGGGCGGPILGTPATFIFGFAGVGGTPVDLSQVPEPTSMLLVGTGGSRLLSPSAQGFEGVTDTGNWFWRTAGGFRRPFARRVEIAPRSEDASV